MDVKIASTTIGPSMKFLSHIGTHSKFLLVLTQTTITLMHKVVLSRFVQMCRDTSASVQHDVVQKSVPKCVQNN